MMGKRRPNRGSMVATALVAMTAAAMASFPDAREAQPPTDRLDAPALERGAPEQGVILDIVTLATERLIAVGEQGRIVYSDDAGATWRQATSPVSVELTSLAFNGNGVGVAVGHDGVILRSTDAGETWTHITDGRDLFPRLVAAAQARVDAAEAALAEADDDAREDAEFLLDDESYRLETAETSMSFGPSWPFLDVLWSDATTLWAVGAYGLAYRSTSSGEEWTYVGGVFDNPEDFHLYSMLRTRSGVLVAAGEAGVLFRSDDDGASWERFDSFDGASLFGLAEIGAPGATHLISYGFGDTYQISADDGLTWDSRYLDDTAILIGHVSGGSPDSVRAVGASGRMVELGVDGVIAQTQPLGDRSFLSVGVDLGGEADGRLLLATEAGLRFTGEGGQ